MGFELQPNEEQRALTDTLHHFAQEVLRPSARECEEAGRTSPDLAGRVHALGVTAPVEEAFGGGGSLDAVTYCMAAEELSWGDPGIAYQALGSGLAALVLGLAGAPEQRAHYLPYFAAPEAPRAFVALGERFAAGDLEALETTIDENKVSGEKYGVLEAAEARLGIVVGRSPEGLGAVLVEGGSYDVVKPEDKLGLQAAPTSVVRFDAAGEAITGGPALERAVLLAKLSIGAVAVGCARASYEYAAHYAREREAFGKPIGAFQAISFKIADMAIAVDAARVQVWRAAWKLDRGRATLADVAEANGVALAAAVRCGDDAVQILGGHGYIRDFPVEKWFRDAVTLSVFDAPDIAGDAMVSRSVFDPV